MAVAALVTVIVVGIADDVDVDWSALPGVGDLTESAISDVISPSQ